MRYDPMCQSVSVLNNGEHHPCDQYAMHDSLLSTPGLHLCTYHDRMALGLTEPAPTEEPKIRGADDSRVEFVRAVDDDGLLHLLYLRTPTDPRREGPCPLGDVATEVPASA